MSPKVNWLADREANELALSGEESRKLDDRIYLAHSGSILKDITRNE